MLNVTLSTDLAEKPTSLIVANSHYDRRHGQ